MSIARRPQNLQGGFCFSIFFWVIKKNCLMSTTRSLWGGSGFPPMGSRLGPRPYTIDYGPFVFLFSIFGIFRKGCNWDPHQKTETIPFKNLSRQGKGNTIYVDSHLVCVLHYKWNHQMAPSLMKETAWSAQIGHPNMFFFFFFFFGLRLKFDLWILDLWIKGF
jgi:hypothetical protein